MKRMKKTLCLAVAILLMITSVPVTDLTDIGFGITASALSESGKCGDTATYTFDSETGKLVISGTGALYNNAFRENTEIKNVIIGDNITKINAGVFDVCSNLESVHFGDNVTEIDYFAFGDCKSLKSVELSKNLTIIGDKTFQYCENLEKVILYENVTTLKHQSFYDCFNLKSINIPKKVTFIGEGVFRNCNSLADVYYEGSEEEWNLIEIGENNTGLDNAKIHYNSIMPYDCEHKTVTTVFKKQPTCTEKGTKAHYICSDCKSVVMSDGESYELYTNSLTIPALGHNFKLYISNNNATCTKNSTEWAACDRGCGAKDVRDIPNTALGHQEIIRSNDNGKHTVYCTRSGCGYDEESACSTASPVCGVIPTCDVCKKQYGNEVAHELQDKEVIKKATCTEKGKVLKKCARCDYTEEVEVNALGHKMALDSVVAKVTCTTDGREKYKCITCGETQEKLIPATGHTLVKSVVAPTCKEYGYDKYSCEKCDYVEKKNIGTVLEHDYMETKVDPTCTKDGSISYKCKTCGGSKASTVLPALGHSWSSTKVVTKDPTCTAKGSKATICTRNGCSVIKEGTVEEIAMKPHDYKAKAVTKEATCETAGEKAKVCKNCTAKTDVEVIYALGHDWSVDDKESATCVDDGCIYYICRREFCSAKKEEIIPATGVHDMDCWDEKYPTCTEEGVIRYGCLLCDYTYTESIPCLGHNYEGGGFTGNCTEDGFIEFHCSNCGDSYTENFPALGHTYPDNWSTILEPDCQSKGASIKVCLNCNNVISQTLPKTGHVDLDGDNKCDTCDKTIAVVEPEKPSEPEEKPCDCDCHAGGIKAFFFKFLNFFAKLFDKSKRVCTCGTAH